MSRSIPKRYLQSRDQLEKTRSDTLESLESQSLKVSMSNPSIDFASLYVTGRCHLKCPHCYAEEEFEGLSKDAPTEQLVRIINSLCEITNRIQLTGGEVFVRTDPISRKNDTLLLVDEIHRRNREIILQTTGMHLSNEMLDYCAQRMPD